MPKHMKRAGRVLLSLSVLLVLAVGALGAFVLLGKDQALRLPLSGVTPQAIANGVYRGSHQGFRFSNAVEVTVKEHRITDIRVTQKQVFAKPETIAALTGRVLAAQTTAVDAVSGCTADSRAFLKAVENALEP